MNFLAIVALAAAAVSAVPNYGDGGYGAPAPSYGAPAGGYGAPTGGYGGGGGSTAAIKHEIKRLKRKLAKKLLCDNSHTLGQRCSETGNFWFCEPDSGCKKGKWVRVTKVKYLSNLSNMYEPSFAEQYRTLEEY
jgi:hypothetical protein